MLLSLRYKGHSCKKLMHYFTVVVLLVVLQFGRNMTIRLLALGVRHVKTAAKISFSVNLAFITLYKEKLN